jgi:pyruvate ferredoxin oxidoreductase beta subunit
VEKLGLETGIWPLKEYVDGVVKHTYVPGVMKPVEQYLETQTRYRHLFRPEKKEDVISRIQEDVNRYWTEASKAEGFQVRLIGT